MFCGFITLKVFAPSLSFFYFVFISLSLTLKSISFVNVAIKDILTGQMIAHFKAHDSPISALYFAKSGNLVSLSFLECVRRTMFRRVVARRISVSLFKCT
jgi:hypothetical protein